MKRPILPWFLRFALFAGMPCFAQSETLTLDPQAPTQLARRVEVLNGRNFSEPRNGRLRPERVYVVFDESLKSWVYTITNFRGELALPLEALAPGTVVEGERVGGEPASRYVLSRKAKWEKTQLPLQRRFWIASSRPEFHIYLPVDRTARVARPEPSTKGDRRPAGKRAGSR